MSNDGNTVNFLDLSYSELESSAVMVSSDDINSSHSNEDERVADLSTGDSEFVDFRRNTQRQSYSENAKSEEVDNAEQVVYSVPNPIPDCDIDNNLPETVILLRTEHGSKVYVVGTVHFSHESQEDVSNVIRAVQPDYVVVELCRSREHMLFWEEDEILEQAKNIDFRMMRDIIKNNGVVQGAMYLMLLSVSAQMTREFGMAPGGEFRRAYKEAKNIPGCVLHLGDRPIHITLRRALGSLSWWQTIKLAFHLIFYRDPIKKEDVEKCKKRDFLEEMISEMAGDFPGLQKVFVSERDIFLTFSLQNAASLEEGPNGLKPCKVVGVVGIGHLFGIQENWERPLYNEIPKILQLPPPSRTPKILRFTVKTSFICLMVYGIHRLAFKSSKIPSFTDIKNFAVSSLQYFDWKN